MNDLLELLDGGGIVHHLGGQLCAIDLAVDGRAGKCRLDRGRRLAFIDFVNGGIGVVNRHAGLREQFCGGGFSHPDRAGQSKDPHVVCRSLAMFSNTEQLLAAQESKQRQQRQAENREMIALDALEQMHAEPFELIGADAGRHGLAGLHPDRLRSRSRLKRRMVMRATDNIGKHYLAVAGNRNGGMQFMRIAGKRRN